MGSKEASVFSAVLILCMLIGCIFIFFFVALKKQFQRNLELQRRNSVAEISAIEKERRRIAADLHDEIAPFLSLMRANLTAIKLYDEEDLSIQKAVEIGIDEIVHRLRTVSYDLMPSILLEKGVICGINSLVNRIAESNQIDILFSSTKEEITIAEQTAIHIYRIVLEVLHNIIKHSRATEVLIDFDKKENELHLKIADNGIGLDYEKKLNESSGFGLRSIQNRIDIMGGKMFVDTTEGKGLSYIFEIPLQ